MDDFIKKFLDYRDVEYASVLWAGLGKKGFFSYSGACWASLKLSCVDRFPLERFVTAYNKNNIIKDKPYIEYLDWLINKSWHSDIFITKDPNIAIDYVEVNVNAPASLVMFALTAWRYVFEYKDRVRLWYALVSKGFDPDKAFILLHLGRTDKYISKDDKDYKEIYYLYNSFGIGNHGCLHGKNILKISHNYLNKIADVSPHLFKNNVSFTGWIFRTFDNVINPKKFKYNSIVIKDDPDSIEDWNEQYYIRTENLDLIIKLSEEKLFGRIENA